MKEVDGMKSGSNWQLSFVERVETLPRESRTASFATKFGSGGVILFPHLAKSWKKTRPERARRKSLSRDKTVKYYSILNCKVELAYSTPENAALRNDVRKKKKKKVKVAD